MSAPALIGIRNEIELAIHLREVCGAEGYRIVPGGLVLALRWDSAGNEIVIDRFAYTVVN